MKLKVIAVIATVVALTPLVALGCSAKGDFEKLCNAPELSGAAREVSAAKKSAKLSQWVGDNIHSGDVVKTVAALANVAPDQKGAILKQAAVEAGYTGPCPMAEMR